jgi:hypothetical protein
LCAICWKGGGENMIISFDSGSFHMSLQGVRGF